MERFSRILAPLANAGTIAVKQKGGGRAQQRQKRRNRRPPMNTDAVVDVSRNKGEDGAEYRSEDGVGSQHRRCVDGVRVDKVVHDAEIDENDAKAEWCRADDAHDPVDRRVVGPGEPELANRDGYSPDHALEESGFWGCKAAESVLDLDKVHVGGNSENDANYHANHDSEEG